MISFYIFQIPKQNCNDHLNVIRLWEDAYLSILFCSNLGYKSTQRYNPYSTTCDTSYLRHPDIGPVLQYCNKRPLTELFSGAEG